MQLSENGIEHKQVSVAKEGPVPATRWTHGSLVD